MVRRARVAEDPGDAEVEDLHRVAAGEHEVRGLHVAVDDELLVRGRKAARRLRRDAQRPLGRERAPGNDAVERLALVERHRDEEVFAGLVHLEDRADVRVIEGRRGLRFAQDAPPQRRVGRRPQELQRDAPSEAQIGRSIHLAHGAGAEELRDLVMRDVASGLDGNAHA